MTIDLDELARLELAATHAWQDVHDPSRVGAGQSINPVTNKEMLFIKAHRADQAVAAWWITRSAKIKELIRRSQRAA